MARIKDVEITDIGEVPVMETVVENYEADVPEEVVQAVAEAIPIRKYENA